MKTKHILITLIAMAVSLSASAQQQQLTPEEEDKKMRERIEELVVRMEEDLELEVWQTFYLDSILNHNYGEMMKESNNLAKNRVENGDLYQMISDKWEEETYVALSKILAEDQWKKYLKTGAGRAKKSRDQRAAKRERNK